MGAFRPEEEYDPIGPKVHKGLVLEKGVGV